MMQSELLHNCWSSIYHQTEFCGIQIDPYENQKHSLSYSSLNSKNQDSFSDFTSLFPDDVLTDFPMDDLEFDDVCRWLNDSESEGNGNMNISCKMQKDGDLWSPALSGVSSEPSIAIPSTNSAIYNSISLVIPGNSREMDTEMRLHHLLAAYGEAMENDHKELAEVIIRSIKGKINPLGESLERIASNLFQQMKDQGHYLKQESSKIFEAAFKAFYQIFPLGKFAHFAANSAIIEAMPNDAETIHIIDFDMGEGIQWPRIIEAIGQKRKALRFTSIKKTEEESASDQWRFEETQRRLLDYAKPFFGPRLQIDEMTIEELASEMRRIKKIGKGSKWLVFNCMFKIPHMGKRRSRIQALEFLKLAKELLSTHKGLVTFGDGEAMDNSLNTNTFSAFFNKNLIYYQSIFESLELYFPAHLAEARLAVESLFLAPQVCSFSWLQNWEEMISVCDSFGEIGLQGKRISKENLLQAKELVNERATPLKVRIEEQRQHEMVLEWKGTPLVRVSTWMQ
ncbi:protein NODULATION SIGNALING PATHWAY 2-like [Lycium barbarum]|uniref:protein NODULATION SIGNALING PATHWAY 2-like n=1 Tax=Lycium barbarum TaxID=112863 RepID=UPI00293E5A09|nr:protein NODULATION SIGNALING PATHWAY 2-like [Lycium barbarum]